MFLRPVDTLYPVSKRYGDKGPNYFWSIDPENKLWIPIQDKDGMGHHRGTDYDCPRGTIVRAICDGFIIRSRLENYLDTRVGAGLYITQLVTMLGFDNHVVRYSHLKSIHVYPGQTVKKGQPIAESGNSGDIQSPILHVDMVNLKHQWMEIPD